VEGLNINNEIEINEGEYISKAQGGERQEIEYPLIVGNK
jgi:hypothetical protein